ncbi:MAG: tRNA modification GTPase [Clostridiales bacterium]|nr:tRNA modification GTPase [Clostridiales bacterium]
MKTDKIITAVSTAVGKGGIAIVRMSGKGCFALVREVFVSVRLSADAVAVPNKMYFGRIDAGGVSDVGYAVFFGAPHSFTGEDTVEFHCHGSEAFAAALVGRLCAVGASPAARGEFTKRAFLNGKLTLSDAEGVIDMIRADSEASLKAAYRMMSGGLSKEIYALQTRLLAVIAGLEAALDYPEEFGGIEAGYAGEIGAVRERARELVSASRQGGIIKKGAAVALVGAPNTGKSSLLNRFLNKDRAIVTDIAGTTRDTLEESVEYRGVRLNLIDTAGLREGTSDAIEKRGIERSFSAAKGADFVVYVLDGAEIGNTAVGNAATGNVGDIEAYSDEVVRAKAFLKDFEKDAVAVVLNKTDLLEKEEQAKSNKGADRLAAKLSEEFEEYAFFAVSAVTGEGIERLLTHIAERFMGGGGDAEIMTNERHIYAVKRAKEALDSAVSGFGNEGTECVLVDLKAAWFALGEITGQTASEAIVDEIFSKFCLGK